MAQNKQKAEPTPKLIHFAVAIFKTGEGGLDCFERDLKKPGRAVRYFFVETFFVVKVTHVSADLCVVDA